MLGPWGLPRDGYVSAVVLELIDFVPSSYVKPVSSLQEVTGTSVYLPRRSPGCCLCTNQYTDTSYIHRDDALQYVQYHTHFFDIIIAS